MQLATHYCCHHQHHQHHGRGDAYNKDATLSTSLAGPASNATCYLTMPTTVAGSRLKLNVSVDIANRAELRANAQQILATTRAARPKNTNLAYNPKQKEFKVRSYSIR